MDDKLYYIYIIRCMDNSLYTGITTDVKRRYSEHISRRSNGEKYTRSRKPVSIEAVWKCVTRSDASRLECAIKSLVKHKKETLINDPVLLSEMFNNRINPKLYSFADEYKGYSVK